MSPRPSTAAGASGGPDELRRLVRDCALGDVARNLLVLRLSELPQEWRKPHHLRLADTTLEALSRADRGRLFTLRNGDLAAVWRGADEASELACRAAVSHLFADALPGDPATLLVRLALPADAALATRLIDQSEAGARKPSDAPQPLPPLDTARLAELETALASADLARFARRRHVVEVGPGQRPTLRWERRALSLAELAANLAPAHDIRADRWLYRRLTRTLDQRMLALLAARGELDGAGPFGLALNIGSVLSPAFLRFDAALPARLRGGVVIEIEAADLLADVPAALFARNFSRARGYRMMLGGLCATTLDIVAPASAAFDYLLLAWSQTLARRTSLPESGATCVISAEEDSDAAAGWAMQAGIRLLDQAPARLDH